MNEMTEDSAQRVHEEWVLSRVEPRDREIIYTFRLPDGREYAVAIHERAVMERLERNPSELNPIEQLDAMLRGDELPSPTEQIRSAALTMAKEHVRTVMHAVVRDA